MRDRERWPDDGSPGAGESRGSVPSLAAWPGVDLATLPPVRLMELLAAEVARATANNADANQAAAAPTKANQAAADPANAVRADADRADADPADADPADADPADAHQAVAAPANANRADADPADADPADAGGAVERACLGAVAACERLERYLGALKVRFMHQAVTLTDGRPGEGFEVFTGVERVGGELGALFGVSRRTMQNRLHEACQLAGDLPRIVSLVQGGTIDLVRARAVNDVMREVLDPERDAEVWARVHEKVAERAAAGLSYSWLREVTRREIHNADPDAAARRHEDARDDRRVGTNPLPDAMSSVTAVLPADQAQFVDTVLDALADGCRDTCRAAGTPDERTHEQRRADAFVALFRSAALGVPLPVLPRVGDAGHFGGHVDPATDADEGVLGWWRPPALPTQQGRRPQITVTMTLATLTGLDQQAGDLRGYGPIPADLARAIAAEAARYRVVVVPDPPRTSGTPDAQPAGDPLPGTTAPPRAPNLPGPPGRLGGPARREGGWHGPGDLSDCAGGEKGYRPGQRLVDRVVAFHQECRHPHCTRRAEQCDLDHLVEHPDGPTCFCNLIPGRIHGVVATP